MNPKLNHGIAVAGFLSVGALATLDAPKITKIEQISRNSGKRVTVTTVSVGGQDSRTIYLTGPWLDYASSVNESGDVSGTSPDKSPEGIFR